MLRELDIAIDKQDFPLDQQPIDPSPLASTSSSKQDKTHSVLDIASTVLRRFDDDHPDEQQEDDSHLVLSDNLRQLSLENRFFGKSSGAMLIQTALELKNEYNGTGAAMPSLVFGAAGVVNLTYPKLWMSLHDGGGFQLPRIPSRYPNGLS